jgi:alkyl hydroperoxide reductase subunit D
MEALQAVKDRMPEYAKDIRLNLDSTIARSSLTPEDALGVALAAAFAARSKPLIEAFKAVVPPAEGHAALTAAALMGMNNVWYPYVEMSGDEDLKTQRPELRMNAYANRAAEEGGLDDAAAARRRPHCGGGQRGSAGARCRMRPSTL